MIYFIRTSSGLIKIGTTENLIQRMNEVKAKLGKDLVLLATIPGGRLEGRAPRCLCLIHLINAFALNPKLFAFSPKGSHHAQTPQ